MPRPAYSADKIEEIEATIREAALECCAQAGYRGLSLRAVAARLGWSATALYRYYDNKDTLLAALRQQGFETLRARLAETEQAGQSPEAVIRELIGRYLDFALAHPELYRLMYEFDQGELETEFPDVTRARRAAFGEAERIAGDLLEGLKIDADPNTLVHQIWIAAHGLIALDLANQLDLGKRYEQLIEPIIQLALQSLPKA